jgi:HrpA-like RNA helicase
MSATLETNMMLNFFKVRDILYQALLTPIHIDNKQDAALVTVHGRQFPVDVYYTKEPEADYLDAAFITCLQVD